MVPERTPLLTPLLPLGVGVRHALGNRITLGTQTETGKSLKNSDYLSMVHSRARAGEEDFEMNEIFGGKEIRMKEMG